MTCHAGHFVVSSVKNRITVQPPLKVSLERLRLYLDRLERDIAAGKRAQALADCAELAEVARRLWSKLSRFSNG
jgi:hypothetical protein